MNVRQKARQIAEGVEEFNERPPVWAYLVVGFALMLVVGLLKAVV